MSAVTPSGGIADVFLDGEKQTVPIDFWNQTQRAHQIVYYKNGLPNTRHTLKIIPRGSHNPYSDSDNVNVEAVQYSAEDKADNFPTGTGPTGAQRMIFGYASCADYRDSHGNFWRPGMEIAAHLGQLKDTANAFWRTNAVKDISGTSDPELYRYGFHGQDFRVNLTVGPGEYDLRLAFANTRNLNTQQNCFDILINGKTVVEKLDVTATAGGLNKAVDLVFQKIKPLNGLIEIRFQGEAFVQALELAPSLKVKGAKPVSSTSPPIRVACVGDSITYGYGIKNREHDCYPAQLAAMLGPKWEVRNFGVNGATALRKGTRPYLDQPAWHEAVDFKPDVVVIKLGTNDTNKKSWPPYKDDFAGDYLEIIHTFQALDSKPRIYVCRPVPLFRDRGKEYDTDKILTDEVILKINSVATGQHLPIIDLYAPFEGKSALFPDGVHPNAKGARIMAETVYTKLLEKAP